LGKEKRSLSQAEVKQLEKFIYARNWNQMAEAFKNAGGISKAEKDEVLQLMRNKEQRIWVFDKLASTQSGQKAMGQALSVWLYYPNDLQVNFKKIDISPYINDPSLPKISDPYPIVHGSDVNPFGNVEVKPPPGGTSWKLLF
jgi:hypothetical protein